MRLGRHDFAFDMRLIEIENLDLEIVSIEDGAMHGGNYFNC